MSDTTTKPKSADADEENTHPPHAWLPDAHFGTAITPLPAVTLDPDPEPDDEEMEATPPDVVWMLGFDPLDEDAEEGED